MAGADARSGICYQIPYGGNCIIADTMHKLMTICAGGAMLDALMDALMAADRAHLDGALMV